MSYEAINRLINPQPIQKGTAGIAVMILSIVLTFGLVAFQRRVIRQTGSLAIGADSLHYSGDLFMNLAVIAALVITNATGIGLVDPIFALGIAAFLVFRATRIAKGSLDTLMDRELPHADRKRIRDIVLAHPATRDMHDLRTRNAGNTVFIELHLELDSHLTLADAATSPTRWTTVDGRIPRGRSAGPSGAVQPQRRAAGYRIAEAGRISRGL